MAQETQEKELELALQKEHATLRRQQLLKRLWQLRRKRASQPAMAK